MQVIDAYPPGRKGSRRPDAVFHRRIRHLHSLGPRPIGEVLATILRRFPQANAVVDEQLARFAELDPAVVRWLGADDWLEPASVLHLVAGGRRS
jgi:hypothetical protein